jgi:hypothetical protein
MIKSLNKSDILVTPFEAKKNWEVDNLNPTDLILWMSQSIDPITGITSSLTGNISHIYIDYGDNNAGYDPSVVYPITNSHCNLALQQQNTGYISYQKGVFNQDILYPTASFYTASSIYYNSESNPRNIDLTYKNIIYTETEHLFYNTYNNFTKTFGMENADLTLTSRVLTDTIDVFTIPRSKFGEKLIPNSIKIIDDSFDKKYTIVDDGNCNLIFSGSVFSTYEKNYLLNNLSASISTQNSSSISFGVVPLGTTGQFHVTSSTVNLTVSGGVAPYIYQWTIQGDNNNQWTIVNITNSSIYLTYNSLVSSSNDVYYSNTYVNCQISDNINFIAISNNLYISN